MRVVPASSKSSKDNGWKKWEKKDCEWNDGVCCVYRVKGDRHAYGDTCPNYRGVEEEGVLCEMPNSLEYILGLENEL